MPRTRRSETQPMNPSRSRFDPHGIGYDRKTADVHGIKPDSTGHRPSRLPLSDKAASQRGVPKGSGLILKGSGHETFHKTVKGEREAGMKIFEGPKGRLFSGRVTREDVAKRVKGGK